MLKRFVAGFVGVLVIAAMLIVLRFTWLGLVAANEWLGTQTGQEWANFIMATIILGTLRGLWLAFEVGSKIEKHLPTGDYD